MLIRNTNGAYVHSEGRQLVFDLPDRTKLNEQSPSPNEEEEYWHPQTPLHNGPLIVPVLSLYNTRASWATLCLRVRLRIHNPIRFLGKPEPGGPNILKG